MERYPCSLMGSINIVKMGILPKVICRLQAIPRKIPMAFFTHLEKAIQLFIWKHKRPSMFKIFWKAKNTTRGIISDPNLYYELTVTKPAWNWQKNRHVGQWNPIGNSEMNPHKYGHILDKCVKKVTLWWGEEFIQQMVLSKPDVCQQRMQVDLYPSPGMKTSWRWSKFFHSNTEPIKLLEENIGDTIPNTRI